MRQAVLVALVAALNGLLWATGDWSWQVVFWSSFYGLVALWIRDDLWTR